jgi:starch synthase (maltosyl-transferring)
MQQLPRPGDFLLKWAGDLLEITLQVDRAPKGRAVFRTNIGRASIRRKEIIAHTESGEAPLARDWHDIPMTETSPGHFIVRIPLTEVGLFSGKACFFEQGRHLPHWPAGDNLRIKVEPAHTAVANTMYTLFVRQFGEALHRNPSRPETQEHEQALEEAGYTVIPPSGTFRAVIRQLDHIMQALRFRIVQLLPIHPTPTTYARMGRYGSPFATLDFLSVDPALAEFDTHATPLDQFRELVDAVHSRSGHLYLDLPANHTGWAATLQNHHPDWYHRKPDGEFVSPGAWGVIWADLVELDYNDPRLRAYMANVFLYWCRQGVDGFRCDAGYMIPVETWTYIVARVREEYPDCVFLLEGLGGSLQVTERLLTEANLNWAYSELFQTDDRSAMEWYLPQAFALAEKCGPLIHFAETHDNMRLAARGGPTFARMRTALSALFSHQGAFGMANGVEWFASERIDVHGASALNWGAHENQVQELLRLTTLLSSHPAFGTTSHLRMIQQGEGAFLALVRELPPREGASLLVLVNFDCHHPVLAHWDKAFFKPGRLIDLLTGAMHQLHASNLTLQPGQVVCLSPDEGDLEYLNTLLADPMVAEPQSISKRRRNLMAMKVKMALSEDQAAALAEEMNPDCLGEALIEDPVGFCARTPGGLPRCATWTWPEDTRREVMIPQGHLLLVRAPHAFMVTLKEDDRTLCMETAVQLKNGQWCAFITPPPYAGDNTHAARRSLHTIAYLSSGIQRHASTVLLLPAGEHASLLTRLSGPQIRAMDGAFLSVLSNGAGAMSHVRIAWGELRSQYDCLLAVNPHPTVPVDKRIFWTRCRAWLNYRGYSQEINKSCLTYFDADPAGRFAEWFFMVPCGMGQWVPLSFRLEIEKYANRVNLVIMRHVHGEALKATDEVSVILRPDIEWRSFHESTKAYTGPEKAWPAAIHSQQKGFTFSPASHETLAMEVTQGHFTHEPAWLYQVPHPDEAERGLDGTGDLFSPGWFGLPLKGGEVSTLSAWRHDEWTLSSAQAASHGAAEKPAISREMPLVEGVADALSLYVVRRDALSTVIAGYPWFLDWGRDTLIALRGLIAAGRHDTALNILREFARFEKAGTLPNMIRGEDDANRETSDAPLWLCVAAGDLMKALKDDDRVLNMLCGSRPLRDVLLSILSHYRDGTPNGIHMDPESGLIYSPPHYTWMDTNYPAATPREGYPIDIQALWIAALQSVARKIDLSWVALAERATDSVRRYFVMPEGWLADCLRATPGVSAKDAILEDTLRPNQLLAVTLEVLHNPEMERAILRACESLLVPGAIRSLADRPVKTEQPVRRDGVLLNDPHHPYQGHYLGDEDTRRKPAYHNGTAWTWPFPLYVEALVKVYGEEARETGLSLLSSSLELINRGCLCHSPEICDGDAPHLARGCVAQAWGMSELLRVWKKIQP